jgi:hypothetical protein
MVGRTVQILDLQRKVQAAKMSHVQVYSYLSFSFQNNDIINIMVRICNIVVYRFESRTWRKDKPKVEEIQEFLRDAGVNGAPFGSSHYIWIYNILANEQGI